MYYLDSRVENLYRIFDQNARNLRFGIIFRLHTGYANQREAGKSIDSLNGTVLASREYDCGKCKIIRRIVLP